MCTLCIIYIYVRGEEVNRLCKQFPAQWYALNVINVGYPLEDIVFKFENSLVNRMQFYFFFHFIQCPNIGKGSKRSWIYMPIKSDNGIHE